MKWYVRGIVIALIVSLIGLVLIIRSTIPSTAIPAIKIAFFLSLFVGLWSLITLALYGIRRSKSDATLARSYIYGLLLAGSVLAIILANKLLI